MSRGGRTQWTRLNMHAQLIVTVAPNCRKAQRYLRKFRFIFDCLDRSSFITADQLRMSVNDHLGSIDNSATKARRVCALSFTVFTGRVRILPSYIVPVIHVFTENDELRSVHRLRSVELCQKSVRRRTTGAALGRKQFYQYRGARAIVVYGERGSTRAANVGKVNGHHDGKR